MMKFLRSKSTPEPSLVILGVPLEATETFRGGVSKAPDEIRRVSQSLESYSVFFNRDLRNLNFNDLGNLSLKGKVEDDLSLLEKKIASLVTAGKKFFVLGGEHTVSVGIAKGITRVLRDDFQVVIFDAHSDFRDNWEGQKINHSTVTRRIHEINRNISVIGVRSFYGYEDYSQPIYTTLEETRKKLNQQIPVYLSIDIDALDVSVAPGVTNPEPDGLKFAEIWDFIHFLKDFSIVGMDLVEVSPPFDPAQITSITAAKLVIEGLFSMSYR